MTKALIFDLDGTLWDASVPITEAWRIVGRKFFGENYSLTVDKVRSLMGKTMAEIAEALTPEGTKPNVASSFAEECFSYERDYLVNHPGKLFPHELETLHELAKDHHLFIVSNCQAGYIETFLPLAPGLFLDHKCWSDTRKEKDVTIRLLMSLHHIDEAIYIGDTEKDEKASRAAGIKFVHAAYGFGGAISPDASARSFSDLVSCLRAL